MKNRWKKCLSGILAAVLLTGSLCDYVEAATTDAPEEDIATYMEMDGSESEQADTTETQEGIGEDVQAGTTETQDGIGADAQAGIAETRDGIGTMDGGTQVMADGSMTLEEEAESKKLQMQSISSSVQGYNEIILKLKSSKKAIADTATEKTYYEIKVTAAQKYGEALPAGSPIEPIYYYVPKTAGVSKQVKAVKVHSGSRTSSTACTYLIEVRLVTINKELSVPDPDVSVSVPMLHDEIGNTVKKYFKTKEVYYAKKLDFTKKRAKIYTGQPYVYVGSIKYNEYISYLHNLTAVAYDSVLGVEEGISCEFRNDTDDLYLAVDPAVKPGTYKIKIYASNGDSAESDIPQSGNMYQASATFSIQVVSAIHSIDTSGITNRVAVDNKNISFSALPVGYNYYDGTKAKTQKFSHTIMSAYPNDDENGFTVTEPVEKVKKNIVVNSKGKVTVKKGYYVDPDIKKNYIAIVIKAADYPENPTTATTIVHIVSDPLVPTQVYLTDNVGNTLSNKLPASSAHGAKVVVLDQYGDYMNEYVTITPKESKDAVAYVEQNDKDRGDATLYVQKPATVEITATAKDGSKKSKTIRVKITTPSFSGGYYTVDSVKTAGFEVGSVTAGDGVVYYDAPKSCVIRYQQGAKINGEGCYHWDWFNWQYSVSGGGATRSGEYLLLRPSVKKTKVTMWMKSDSAHTFSVEFINNSWDAEYQEPAGVKKISGKLYSTKYSNVSDLILNEDGTYTVPPQEVKYHYEHGSYDSVQLIKISKKGPDLTMKDFDPSERTFVLTTDEEYLTPGNYDYGIAFYRDNRLMSKPGQITITVSEATPIKIQQDYELDITKSSYITLKCKPTEFMPVFQTTLLNANVEGKSNGFNTYFELAIQNNYTTGEQKAIVRLKQGLSADKLVLLRGRTLAGYVRYSYYNGKSYVRDATSKIVISIAK